MDSVIPFHKTLTSELDGNLTARLITATKSKNEG